MEIMILATMVVDLRRIFTSDDIAAGSAEAGRIGEDLVTGVFNGIGWKAWFVAAAHYGIRGVAKMDSAALTTGLEAVPPAFPFVDGFCGLGVRGVFA